MVPVTESREKQFFAATSARFPAEVEGEGRKGDVAMGIDGINESGCNWVSLDGEPFP
jgi:hypothetical protein